LLPTLKGVAKRILGPTLARKLRRPQEEAHDNDFYDTLTYQVLEMSLSAKSICVDVGCHEGLVLTTMMKLAPEGKFYAFEPIPEMLEDLKSRFPSPPVTFSGVALSNQAGVVSFNHVVSNPGYSGLRKRTYDRPDETDRTISVQTDLLDNLVPETDHVGVIKVDVEGAELQVFQGAVGTIKRCRPVIVFEHGLGAADCYGTRPNQIYDLLCGECRLNISLLQNWLDKGKPLTRKGFEEQFDQRKNFYFIAHPTIS
jgi:FkbM family methyltransferase